MDQLRPFRIQLDERYRRVPFRVLRLAYQAAVDTRNDNADQPETVRDYWPTCIEMVLFDHDLITADECKLI